MIYHFTKNDHLWNKRKATSPQFISVTKVHLHVTGVCHFLFIPKAGKAAFHLVFRPKVQISHFTIRVTRMAPVSQPGVQLIKSGLKSLTRVTGSASSDVCLYVCLPAALNTKPVPWIACVLREIQPRAHVVGAAGKCCGLTTLWANRCGAARRQPVNIWFKMAD